MARYGQAFKDKALARLLAPESAALHVVAQELGVGVSTLERWREQAQSKPARVPSWTAGSRLEAVITTAALNEAAKSAWCREHGVYPSELDQWLSSCTTALSNPEDARASPQATRASAKRIKKLERVPFRNDRALAEANAILTVANQTRFASVPPARIVPMLADEGVYLGSESSMARVLKAHGQNARRGRAKAPKAVRPPSTHIATAPGQVWCWDMTYLPAVVSGRWFHLYLILDLYSRQIVGAEVHESDDANHAVHLVRRTALAEGIAALTDKPVLHGDNGSTLKATTVLAMLNWLGVKPSYFRPRVSDDNAYAEALFRTAKYRPEFPAKGFASLDEARAWAAQFVHWYNHDHRHSGIQYVSPAQRHSGQDHAILDARHALYQQARQKNPARWSGQTRNWTPVDAVTLNPERDSVVRSAVAGAHIKAKAA